MIALQGGDARKKFTAEMAETVLQQVMCGKSVKKCAEEFGIAPGTIHARAYNDEDGFGKRLREAYELRTYTLADTVLEVAYDPNRTAADKKVIIEALQWTAKMDNRPKYGDQVRVDATHSIAPVTFSEPALPALPIDLAPIIEADFTTVEPDCARVVPDDDADA